MSEIVKSTSIAQNVFIVCGIVHADATSVNERRKSWQSYTRLKQVTTVAAAAASFRPRTLATNQSSSLLTPCSASVAARTGATSPPAVDDSTQTHGTLTATLSPIASGSSSVSYAPKSSASTCGGTAVGASGVGVTPDDSTADGLFSHAFLLEVDHQLQQINSYVYLMSLSLRPSIGQCRRLCSVTISVTEIKLEKLTTVINIIGHISLLLVTARCTSA